MTYVICGLQCFEISILWFAVIQNEYFFYKSKIKLLKSIILVG